MAANLEIHRTVRAISIDLDLAIAFYETYVPSGQDATLIDRMELLGVFGSGQINRSTPPVHDAARRKLA